MGQSRIKKPVRSVLKKNLAFLTIICAWCRIIKGIEGGYIMKNKSLIITLVIVVILAIIFASMYNGLSKAQINVEEQLSNVQAQLQRRADLIPNLVNTVKGYAKHESDVFSAVTEAREKLMGASSASELSQADGELTNALGRLIAVAESYPDLKANTTYTGLMDELAGTENRIATVRRDYNSAVTSYNKKVRTFPGNIFAGIFGFEKADFFEAEEGSEKAPQVSFE